MKTLFLSLALCMMTLGAATSIAEAADPSPPTSAPPAAGSAAAPVVSPVERLGPAEPAPAVANADAGGVAKQIISDARSGRWRYVLAGVLTLAMLGLTKVREQSWSPFKGDRGGAALVLLLALATTFGTALASSAPISLDLVLGALAAAFTAAGGYTVIRRLIWPKPTPPKLEAVK